MRSVVIQYLGLIDYMECWALQKKLFDKLITVKTADFVPEYEADAVGQTLLLCEHPHVYTLGKSGKENNLLINSEFMTGIGAEYHRVDRGGDITYHGPGQLVGYPILDLEDLGIGLKDYVHGLEQTIIDTIGRFGIRGERSEGATGVWLAADGKRPLRKIAAIGVRSSHFVTMHGFSLNVKPDMKYFSYINPCGFTDRGVTSMEQELAEGVEMEEVKRLFIAEFEKVFGITTIIKSDR